MSWSLLSGYGKDKGKKLLGQRQNLVARNSKYIWAKVYQEIVAKFQGSKRVDFQPTIYKGGLLYLANFAVEIHIRMGGTTEPEHYAAGLLHVFTENSKGITHV